MRRQLVGIAVLLSALSTVVFIGMVVQYQRPDQGMVLLLAYLTLAILAAVAGAGGTLPRWSAVAAVAATLGTLGLLLWPRQPQSWNDLFQHVLLVGTAAVAIAVIIRESARRSRNPRLSPLVFTPALLWSAAVAIALVGLAVLASFNPVGFGYVASSVALVVVSAEAFGAPRRPFALVLAGLATPVPLVAFLGVLIATGAVGHDRRYEIPAGYRGWVIVEHEATECPPPPTEGGALVFSIDQGGCECTSSSQPRGWSRWTYLAIEPDGRQSELPRTHWGGGGLIWAGFSASTSSRVHPWSGFFVGTQDELERSSADQPLQESRCLRRE